MIALTAASLKSDRGALIAMLHPLVSGIGAYAVNFFGEAMVGSVKQKGIPYINIPLAGAMAVSFGRFCYINAKDEHSLASDTEVCIKKSEEVIQKHDYTAQFISHYDCADDFLNSCSRADNNAKELLDFFEGIENK